MKHKLSYFSRFRSIRNLWIVLGIAIFTLNPSQIFGINKQNEKVVSGTVMLPDGIPASEVMVTVKGTSYYSVTDVNGKFLISTVVENPTLVFSLDDYEPIEVPVDGKDALVVTLKAIRYTELLWTRQKQDYVTSAVSSLQGEEVENLPGVNRNNVLGGRLTGLSVQQSNGKPGIENSSIYIRGLRTLGDASRKPLILIDGYDRVSAEYLNPYDIESVTVLKDAAATAIYGLRGSNGVLLYTTKRGKPQPMRVSLDANFGVQAPTQMPKYLGSYEHSMLYNEASRNDGGMDVYDAEALEAYRTGSNPYKYPNVDWVDEFFKDYSTQQKYNLSMRGGTKQIRYYASAGYVENSGLYKVDKSANTYNTNEDFNVFLLRSNVDVQVNKRLSASMDVSGRIQTWNSMGNMSNPYTTLYRLPPNLFPVFNEDGSIAGNSQYTNNPYGLINLSGYSINTSRVADATFKIRHDLDMITKGLVIRAAISFDSYFDQVISRNKGFVVYQDSLANERGVKEPKTQQNKNDIKDNQRAFDMQFGIDYARTIGLHDLNGRLFWNQNNFSGDGSRMPHTYSGVIGRMNYMYNSRYIADVSFSYQGSEQISDNKQYVLFPALSLGWILSEEHFLKNKSQVISFLKVRGSHGLTGNDSGIGYFQKLSFLEKAGNYLIGDNLQTYANYREGVFGDPDITAEITRKTNIGIDSRFFNDALSFSGDLFFEETTGIILALSDVPGILGARIAPQTNIGIVENKGFEAQLGYQKQINDFAFGIQGNLSYSKSKVIDMQERDYPFAHNYRTGYPLDSKFGYQSIGYFYDDSDIASSPSQTFGPVKPGDLKYKDVTGNGVVDVDDVSYIGKSWMPEFLYGTSLYMEYKGFDLNVLVEGIANAAKYINNYAYWEFFPDGTGKVQELHLDRWAYYPALGVDTRETATYPRLSLKGENTNNKSPNSDFWLKDASYVRLKSVELGYSLPKKAANYLKLSKLRFYATGYNLLTFDHIKTIDPEPAGGGNSYPIQRIVNFGINAQF